jgi:hypothetical protein
VIQRVGFAMYDGNCETCNRPCFMWVIEGEQPKPWSCECGGSIAWKDSPTCIETAGGGAAPVKRPAHRVRRRRSPSKHQHTNL